MSRPPRKPTTYTQQFIFPDGFGGIRYHPMTFRLEPDREIVPLGENAPTFRGYPSVFHALAAASTIPNIGIVYQASRDPALGGRAEPLWFGRFFVFDTGMKPFPLLARSRMAAPTEDGLSVRFTNLEKPADSRSWAQRSQEITHPGNDRRVSDIYPLAKRVVQDFAFLSSSEVNADHRVENKRLDDEVRAGTQREGTVNIDRSDLFRHTGNGYVRPTSPNLCAESSSAIPGAVLALSSVFELPSGLDLLATLAHEGVHLRHFHRAAHLLEQWRTIKGHRPPFTAWVDGLSRRPGSRASRFDHLVALHFCNSGASNLVHFEPHVEAWILRVTHLSVPELKLDAWRSILDLTHIETGYYAQSSSLDIVLKHLEHRLVQTYRHLDAQRRRIVRDAALGWPKQDSTPRPFFEWLARIWQLHDP